MQEGKDGQKYKNILFFSGIGAFAAFIGFSSTLALTKKRYQTVEVNAKGLNLGFKALGIATIISVLGVGSLCYGAVKLFDIKNMQDLKDKAQNFLPRVTKPAKVGSEPGESIQTFEDLIKLLEGK